MNRDSVLNYASTIFNGNPILNCITLFLAIIGVILTIYFYKKSKKYKSPIYAIRTINLIKENIKKISVLDILFNGDKINNLSISKIALWNGGRDTINISDVAQRAHLKIEIEDDLRILDAEIIYHKNVSNNFNIKLIDNKFIEIEFDYFDFEEGIVIQIVHTGSYSQQLNIAGTIKSVKSINRIDIRGNLLPNIFFKKPNRKDNEQPLSYKKLKLIFGIIFLLLGVICTLTICWEFVQTPTYKDALENKAETINIFSKSFLIIFGLFYFWLGYTMIKKRIPKSFDIFNEDEF